MHAVRVTVKGRVQGVSYRAHAQAAGDRLGLMGWVRNLPNGDVEAWAQGEKAAVDGFVQWCHQGSPRSRVGSVTAEDVPPDGGLNSFGVRF